MKRKTKPVVFIAFANERTPGGQYLRNLAKEARQLRQALEPAAEAGHYTLELRQNTTLDELIDVFQKHRNRIVLFHFSGHAGDAELLFETEAGNPQPAHAAGLVGWLGEQYGLRFVFLNGCSSEGHVDGLLDAGVSSVLATSERIDDAVATEFSARFYQSLTSGESLCSAYRRAKGAIRIWKGNDPREVQVEDEIEDQDLSWPWVFHIAPQAAESVKHWTLTGASYDPYFDLPPPPQIDPPNAPYRSLQPFTRDHAPIFFGRGWKIRELYQALTSDGDSPIVLLHGPSGVGKSSLLDAGLRPRLETCHPVIYTRRDAATGLAASLAASFGDPTDLPAAWRRKEADGPLIVILDQVEEAWTHPLPGGGEIRAFVRVLHEIFGSRTDPQDGEPPGDRVSEEFPKGRLLLSFRKSWLAEVEAMLDAANLKWRPVRLWPLDRDDILEAIQGPATLERYRLKIEDELPGRVAEDLLKDPSAVIAPALQILLAKMWRQVEAHRRPRFTCKLYRQLHREGRWLEEFFDEQIGVLEGRWHEAVGSGLTLDLLAHHTTPSGTAASRQGSQVLERYGEERRSLVTRLIEDCRNLYLLSESTESEEEETFRLAHDVLAPIVRRKFDRSDRPGQRARRILENRAVEWSQGEDGPPLDETDLDVAEKGLIGMRSMNAEEMKLLIASRQARDLRAQARQRRALVRRVSLTAILFLLLASLTLASIALSMWRSADARRLAAETLNGLDSHLDRSLLLGLEAYARNPSREDTLILSTALTHEPHLESFLHRHDEFIRHVHFSPEGVLLASSSEDGKVAVWNLEKRQQIAPAPDTENRSPGGTPRLAFVSDGDRLAYSDDGCIRLWDVGSRRTLALDQGLCEEKKEILSLVSSRPGVDSPLLAASWMGGPLKVFDPSSWNGEDLSAVAEIPAMAQAFTLDVDVSGRILAIGGNDAGEICRRYEVRIPGKKAIDSELTECGCLSLFDLSEDRFLVEPVCVPDTTLNSLDYQEALDAIATGWGDRVVRTWKLRQGALALAFESPPHTGAVTQVRFNHDGTRLASAAWDGRIVLWDVAEPDPDLLLDFRGHNGGVGAVAFSPPGPRPSMLASGGQDQRILLWREKPQLRGTRVLERPGDPDERAELCCLLFADDSKLFSAGHDGVITQWDLQSDPEPTTVKVPREISSLAFDASRDLLAAGSADGWTRFLRAGSLARRSELDVEPDPERLGAVRVRAIDFNPADNTVFIAAEGASRYLVRLSSDQPIKRWIGDSVILALKFRPADSSVLTVDNSGRIIQWDQEMAKQKHVIAHDHVSGLLELSHDGRFLASEKGTSIYVYDLTGLDDLAEDGAVVDLYSRVLALHPSNVRSVTFSPNDELLVAGHENGSIVVWDLRSGRPKAAPLMGHSSPVLAVAFAPDGLGFASGDREGKIVLWGLDLFQNFDKAACALANRNLSMEEWQTHIGLGLSGWNFFGRLRPYRRHCPDLPPGVGAPENAPARAYKKHGPDGRGELVSTSAN